jgi:NADP-dependent 3-hydroxy acid dehydrogenase YdfG
MTDAPVALVTGGASGIGAATARRLLDQAHRVAITGRDPDRWRDMVLTNVLGPALLIKAALPALQQTRGRIVLLGSVAGFVHTPGNIYGVAKWAVTGLAENTRRLVTGDGIGVTLIAPGRVATPFWDATGGPPAGGLLTADQVADAIVWAISQPSGVDVNTVIVRPIGQAG